MKNLLAEIEGFFKTSSLYLIIAVLVIGSVLFGMLKINPLRILKGRRSRSRSRSRRSRSSVESLRMQVANLKGRVNGRRY